MSFTGDSIAAATTIHEMGHNWDDPEEMGASRFTDWKALSGWKQSGGNWTYSNTSAPFALSYGKTNPYEDWSTCWERYFTVEYSLPDTQNLKSIGNKYGFIDDFLDTLD